MNLCFWKERKQENANEKDIRLCNRYQERICAKEGKVLRLKFLELDKRIILY